MAPANSIVVQLLKACLHLLHVARREACVASSAGRVLQHSWKCEVVLVQGAVAAAHTVELE